MEEVFRYLLETECNFLFTDNFSFNTYVQLTRNYPKEEEIVSDLIQKAENADVRTVLSNHDFSRTPEKGEILWRLRKMEQLGADIAKIAVMPRRPEDVAVLLGVTSEAVEMMSCPVITMSMGGQGVISRMAGQIFGSAVTFGTVGQASAPGQIPFDRLKEILTLIDSVQ